MNEHTVGNAIESGDNKVDIELNEDEGELAEEPRTVGITALLALGRDRVLEDDNE